MNGTDVVEMDRERPTGQNRDFPWDSFDSASYFDHNYLSMRGDDRIIVEFIRDFFASAGIPEGSRAIDVGTGPNLYPALAVLPFVESIELYEFSAKNVDWLRRQQQAGWPTWDQSLSAFWRLYALSAGHAGLADPRRALADRVSVVQGSVFDLERHPSVPFDAGTMFFCAESLSDDREEFDAAVAQFLGVLKEGAPFAAAFMEMS